MTDNGKLIRVRWVWRGHGWSPSKWIESGGRELVMDVLRHGG